MFYHQTMQSLPILIDLSPQALQVEKNLHVINTGTQHLLPLHFSFSSPEVETLVSVPFLGPFNSFSHDLKESSRLLKHFPGVLAIFDLSLNWIFF